MTTEIHLFAFLDVINCNLIIKRYSNQNGRWTCQIENDDVLQDGELQVCFGEGKTHDEAISHFTTLIAGKTIVVNSSSKKYRKEYQAPTNLIYK